MGDLRLHGVGPALAFRAEQPNHPAKSRDEEDEQANEHELKRRRADEASEKSRCGHGDDPLRKFLSMERGTSRQI
jgi:hypothetical protein